MGINTLCELWLKRNVVINRLIQSYATRSLMVFHIPKAKTSLFGLNTLRYGDANLRYKFWHDSGGRSYGIFACYLQLPKTFIMITCQIVMSCTYLRCHFFLLCLLMSRSHGKS